MLQCDFDRLVKVLGSQMYSRLFLGAFVEGPDLWYWLASTANRLEGDPADWTYEYRDVQSLDHSLRFRDGSREFLVGMPMSKATVVPALPETWTPNNWSLRVSSKRFLLKWNYTYQASMVTDEATQRLVVNWHRMGDINNELVDMGSFSLACTKLKGPSNFRIDIDYGVLMKPARGSHEVITREMTYIHDIAAHRERLKAEKEEKARKAAEAARIAEETRKRAEQEKQRAEAKRQRAEAQRREAEARAKQEEIARIERAAKLRDEQDRLAQRKFEEQAAEEHRRLSRNRRTGGPHDKFRLDNDLCLECGRPIVIRRNNKFGHLFFGCSGWSPKNHESKCNGARPTTCDLCHGEMHERTNAPNSNVLRCQNSPDCPQTRQIPPYLEIHEWLKGERVNESQIRADFTSRGLMQRYRPPEWVEVQDDRPD